LLFNEYLLSYAVGVLRGLLPWFDEDFEGIQRVW